MSPEEAHPSPSQSLPAEPHWWSEEKKGGENFSWIRCLRFSPSCAVSDFIGELRFLAWCQAFNWYCLCGPTIVQLWEDCSLSIALHCRRLSNNAPVYSGRDPFFNCSAPNVEAPVGSRQINVLFQSSLSVNLTYLWNISLALFSSHVIVNTWIQQLYMYYIKCIYLMTNTKFNQFYFGHV